MPLFQKSVLKKHLQELHVPEIDSAYKKFTDYFHNSAIQKNIRESKEEQFQEGFLRELFGTIMGYVLNPNPNYNLTTELKNTTNSKKADGAILIDGKAIAVIELKGTDTTNLNKIEVQAFGYKNNQAECNYVITSNFEKLRFYIDNTIDFEEFNLFTLTRDQFNLLYLCLSYDNMKNNIPKRLKAESVSQEDQITKKLYKDYSEFKRALYNNLVELNPEFDKLLLFKKTQKLLDRFLFIFFAEDTNLLPTNLIFRINKEWKNLQEMRIPVSLYDRYLVYFNDLNHGAKVTLPAFGKKTGEAITAEFEIFAYNGGLFQPDDVLDNVKIDDTVLHTYSEKLSHYDFDSDVDVNILGHIFENSLNEIDEIKSEIEGTAVDKTKTKRKKDGVFYTPKYITKYIVDNTVGKLCTEKKAELKLLDEDYTSDKKLQTKTKKALLDKLAEYRTWLLQLTICDPACGSGAFLNQALEFLIAEHRYVDELQAKLMGDALILSDIETSILENNIYGVDLNDESVEIAKLSLWLRTAQKGRKLNSLNKNIKCGNSLIDDPAVAGEKAFSWENEFPEVFAIGGFDVVIGNPPYVRAELLQDYIEYLKKFEVYNSASDLFAYFYELGIKLIKPELGLMGFISNTFDKTTAGQILRKYLQTQTTINNYIDFTDVQVFEGATTYPVIISIERKAPSKTTSFRYVKIPKSSQSTVIEIDYHAIINVSQTSLDSSGWSFLSTDQGKIVGKIKRNKTIRDKYGKCYYGIKTALNEAFIINKEWPISDHIKLIFEGKEIKKWNTPSAEQKLILFKSKWTKKKYGTDDEQVLLSHIKNDFSEIFEQLMPFEEKGKKRFDKGDFWWELRNCAYYDLFEKPKIIFPNLQNANKFSFDSEGVYVNAPAVFLPTKSKALLCVLNSKIIWEFLKSICVVRSGGYIEVKPQYFEQIPIPDIKNEDEFEAIADSIISLTAQVQSINKKFQKYISHLLKIDTLSKKLQNWHDFTFSDFIKELNKAIKASGGTPLTKKDEFEWMELFEENKQKALELKAQIDQTDKKIDAMVYELYGLTEEEIRIVEGR